MFTPYIVFVRKSLQKNLNSWIGMHVLTLYLELQKACLICIMTVRLE